MNDGKNDAALFRIFLELILILSFSATALPKVLAQSPAAAACESDGRARNTPASYKPLGSFSPTFYRILDESSPEWSSEGRTDSLLTCGGKLIDRVPPSFRRQLEIEGSARLSDGRVINFDKKRNGRWCYGFVDGAPFGIGERGYHLIPFRTVAVDPKFIRLGAVLYVPALVGIRLPSGEVHDGFVFAHDTGQGIIGNRIDIFVGFEVDVDNSLTRSGRVRNKEALCLYEVDKATAKTLRHRFRSQIGK